MKSKVYYTVDAVIFGINNVESDNPRLLPEKKLEVLLTKRTKEPFKDSYVLPGGYVGEEEAASTAIQRVLEKETNLKKVYMEHLNVYDDIPCAAALLHDVIEDCGLSIDEAYKLFVEDYEIDEEVYTLVSILTKPKDYKK